MILERIFRIKILGSGSINLLLMTGRIILDVMLCGRVPAANAPPDALRPEAYCTNPGL